MDSPGEILRLCRLCLVKDQVNIPIFEEEGDSREIFLKISSCLPVKVSREDRLPKKICDGCSEKLNSFYEFWSSSANAEKTLLSWVGEEDVEEKTEPAVSKSLAASATLVKEESEPVDEAHAESIEESTKDEADEAPPAKRARRSAAVKAQINLAPDSEDDDLDMGEPLTKTEEESAESDGEDKDPSYTDMPGTSADDEQAGPSGMGKDGVEAPSKPLETGTPQPDLDDSKSDLVTKFYCNKCGKFFDTFAKLHKHMFEVRSINHRFRCSCCEYIVGRNLVDLILHTKRFCSREDFKVYEGKYPNEIRYYCERCCKGVDQLSELLKHYLEHKNQQLQCDLCSKKVSSVIELLIHYRVHTIVGNIRLPCKLCPLMFYASTPYKLHYYSVHSLLFNIPFECNLCREVIFDDEETFLSHVQGHTVTIPQDDLPKQDVTKLTCEFCAKIFEDSASFRAHKTSMHYSISNETRKCPQCNTHIQTSMISAHLQNHLKEKFVNLPKNSHKRWEKVKSGDLNENSASKGKKKKLPAQTVQPVKTTKEVNFPPAPTMDHSSLELECHQCNKTFLSMLAFDDHQKCHMLEKMLEESKSNFYQSSIVANNSKYRLVRSEAENTVQSVYSSPRYSERTEPVLETNQYNSDRHSYVESVPGIMQDEESYLDNVDYSQRELYHDWYGNDRNTTSRSDRDRSRSGRRRRSRSPVNRLRKRSPLDRTRRQSRETYRDRRRHH